LSACASAGSPAATQAPTQAPPTATVISQEPAPTEAAPKIDPLAFRQAVRKLWEDHITWTRVYVVSAVAGLPEADAAAQRLLQNQADIGDAVRPFYGDEAADQLTSLLRDHILIAADLVTAAKSGDDAGLGAAQTSWNENADQIAALLNGANPESWPLGEMQSMMRAHLDLTLEEATARLQEDWVSDIAAYDKVHGQILEMADMLADGIIRQFPDSFGPQEASQKQIELALAMDKLWEDHVTWTRMFLISATAGLPDADATAERLLQNQTDIGNAIKPFYGDEAGSQLTALLRDHILTAADVVTAAKAGDSAALEAANALWYENAGQIASFLSSANPDNWPLDEMEEMMKSHLDLTLDEATARLEGDWAADIAAYDEVHEQILHMADMLTSGIVAQFPDQLS
jgi:hypothetical protein